MRSFALRLDRLILLLETGSTQQIKSTAAKQLGEVARKVFGGPSAERVVKGENDGVGAEEGEETSGLGVGLDQEEEWKEVMGLVGRVSSKVYLFLVPR